MFSRSDLRHAIDNNLFDAKKKTQIASSIKPRYQRKLRHNSKLEAISTYTLYCLGGYTARR